MDHTHPAAVHHARLDTARYLSRHAAPIWRDMMLAGHDLLVPATAASHWSADRTADHMAELEHRRLRDAELYHLDAAATARATTTPLQPREITALIPAPAGLVVWGRPITTTSGIPVIAAIWGPMAPGSESTWLSWWTDTTTVTQPMRQDNALMLLSINGMLTFDREGVVPPRVWPDQADNPASPVHAFYAGLFGTWEAIRRGLLGTPDTVPAPDNLTAALAAEGLPPRHVNAYGRTLPDPL